MAGHNHNIRTVNKLFENVAELRHLGVTVTNWNCINKKLRTHYICILLLTTQFRIFCHHLLPKNTTTTNLKYEIIHLSVLVTGHSPFKEAYQMSMIPKPGNMGGLGTHWSVTPCKIMSPVVS
jgi:hypothetical protein